MIMNSIDENGGKKKFSRRISRRTLFLKLCISFMLMFVAICLFISPQTLKDSSMNFKQWDIRQLISSQFTWPSNFKQQFHNKKRHLILLWTPYFGKQDWLPSTKQLQCPVDNCDVTSDRLRLINSSALIIHWRDINRNDLPLCPFLREQSSRCPLVVLFNKEAPPHTSSDSLWKMDNKIHWTATYRRDSDIKAPYGKVHLVDEAKMPEINLNRSSICWLVSNCQAPSHREQYVNELKNLIPVEIYGRCGSHSCPHEKTKDCYKWLSNSCRFYLSFENSICKDYSTEKLYYAMMSGMVPIVFGGDNYTEHLPPHSFIDVRDYSSPKELAKYLQELKVNDAEYLKYFEWRKKYLVQDAAYMWLCDLCEKLNTVDASEVKPYKSVVEWWYQYPCDNIYN